MSKLKILLIIFCCVVSSLWSETHCMDDPTINDQSTKKHQTGFIPIGGIISFAGEVAPKGWLLCDGKQYTSQNYSDLYEVIKTKYVPNSELTRIFKSNEVHPVKIFCVPDLRGRVSVGVDGEARRVTSNNTLGASGGEEAHDLSMKEMSVTVKGGNHLLGSCAPGHGSYYEIRDLFTLRDERRDIAHNNMQPYMCLNYIIYAGE